MISSEVNCMATPDDFFKVTAFDACNLSHIIYHLNNHLKDVYLLKLWLSAV
jgi:hypothetical protein